MEGFNYAPIQDIALTKESHKHSIFFYKIPHETHNLYGILIN